jgi:hypothetical protein
MAGRECLDLMCARAIYMFVSSANLLWKSAMKFMIYKNFCFIINCKKLNNN